MFVAFGSRWMGSARGTKSSVAPLGLIDRALLTTGLTPWAMVFRHSVAGSRVRGCCRAVHLLDGLGDAEALEHFGRGAFEAGEGYVAHVADGFPAGGGGVVGGGA